VFSTIAQLLILNPVFVLAVLGYACLTFTVGGLVFWAGEYYTDSLNMPLDRVSLIFGAVSAVAGLLGAVAGGVIMDKLGGTAGKWGIPKGLAVCALAIVPSLATGIACVMTSSPSVAFPTAFGSVFLFSAALAPVSGVILKVVPHDLRAFAFSLTLFSIHLLGDFPSPVLVGWIADGLVSDACNKFCGLRVAMLIMMCWVVMAVLFWTFGFLVAFAKVDAGAVPINGGGDVATDEVTAPHLTQEREHEPARAQATDL
jgi:MFS family permease